MRPNLIALFFGIVVLLTPFPSRGQPCPAGPQPNTVTSFYTNQVLPWSKYFTALTRLGNQFISLYDGDSLTEPLWLTGGAVSALNGTGFRETWYIPRDPVADTSSLFRVYSGPPANSGQGGITYYDHMDSPNTSEGYPDYGLDLGIPHGYPWTAPPPGTLPLTRWYSASIHNHVTYLSDLSRPHVGAVDGGGPYTLDATYSTATPTPRYGFQRFNTCLGDAPSSLGTTLANGTLSVHFNPVWGNAIDSITPSGRPQLVDPAIGAMVQTVVRSAIPCPGCQNGYFPISVNEAGGVVTNTNAQYGIVTLWAGSPTTAIAQGVNSIQTDLKPLSFEADIAPAGEPGAPASKTDIYTPLMWRGAFRRTTQLGQNGDPHVITLGFKVKMDLDAPPEMDNPPGGYNLNHTAFILRDSITPTEDYAVELYSLYDWRLLMEFPAAERQPQTYHQELATEDEAWVIRTLDNSFAVALFAPFSTEDTLKLQAEYWYGPEWIFDTFRLVGSGVLNRETYATSDAYMVIGTFDEVRASLTRLSRTLSQQKLTDFDGDGLADKVVFRPSTSTWWVKRSDGGADYVTQLGTAGDIPVPGRYTGSSRADYAVFRPSSGSWYVRTAGGVDQPVVQFGTSGDIPVRGQYGGGARTDYAVWRPSNGTWYIRTSEGTQLPGVQWGVSGDIPVPGDYDGDGVTDIAVFRPSNGTWYVLFSGGGTAAIVFGTSGDIPVAADFAGNGRSDYGIFRPTSGTWYVKSSATMIDLPSVGWGASGDSPLPAQMGGDSRADYVTWRPSNGTWYVRTSEGTQLPGVQWGVSGDTPLAR